MNRNGNERDDSSEEGEAEALPQRSETSTTGEEESSMRKANAELAASQAENTEASITPVEATTTTQQSKIHGSTQRVSNEPREESNENLEDETLSQANATDNQDAAAMEIEDTTTTVPDYNENMDKNEEEEVSRPIVVATEPQSTPVLQSAAIDTTEKEGNALRDARMVQETEPETIRKSTPDDIEKMSPPLTEDSLPTTTGDLEQPTRGEGGAAESEHKNSAIAMEEEGTEPQKDDPSESTTTSKPATDETTSKVEAQQFGARLMIAEKKDARCEEESVENGVSSGDDKLPTSTADATPQENDSDTNKIETAKPVSESNAIDRMSCDEPRNENQLADASGDDTVARMDQSSPHATEIPNTGLADSQLNDKQTATEVKQSGSADHPGESTRDESEMAREISVPQEKSRKSPNASGTMTRALATESGKPAPGVQANEALGLLNAYMPAFRMNPRSFLARSTRIKGYQERENASRPSMESNAEGEDEEARIFAEELEALRRRSTAPRATPTVQRKPSQQESVGAEPGNSALPTAAGLLSSWTHQHTYNRKRPFETTLLGQASSKRRSVAAEPSVADADVMAQIGELSPAVQHPTVPVAAAAAAPAQPVLAQPPRVQRTGESSPREPPPAAQALTHDKTFLVEQATELVCRALVDGPWPSSTNFSVVVAALHQFAGDIIVPALYAVDSLPTVANDTPIILGTLLMLREVFILNADSIFGLSEEEEQDVRGRRIMQRNTKSYHFAASTLSTSILLAALDSLDGSSSSTYTPKFLRLVDAYESGQGDFAHLLTEAAADTDYDDSEPPVVVLPDGTPMEDAERDAWINSHRWHMQQHPSLLARKYGPDIRPMQPNAVHISVIGEQREEAHAEP